MDEMEENRTVTSLEVQKKDCNRVSVFLDGIFAFGIHQDVLLKSGIARGDCLTAARIEEILGFEERRAAKEKAMRLLAVRSRSKKELMTRLRQAKFSTAAIEWTLVELERLKLVDDAAFAESFARNRSQTRPEGAFLLRRELQQKGLSDADVEGGVAAAFQERSERELAYELAHKKKEALKALPSEKSRKRVNDFLLRRGFDWELIKDILEDWERL
jgi:regulatory protein